MALYRTGSASMDAQGVITGVNTKWREPLSLIRTGATIVFLASPIKLAVINTIDSDTRMTAIGTDGTAAPLGNYVILLNDSLTVDGMAQDVAETLRYYQSKETEIADAIEFFENFDFQQLITLKNQTQQYRNEAEGFKNTAGSSATAAANAKTAAETARNGAQQAQQAAAGSAQAASGSATTASQKAQTATNEANRAQGYADSLNVNNLARKDQANTFSQKQTINNTIQTASSYANPMLIRSVNPTIKFEETDVSGAPNYAFVVDGGNFRIQREDNGAQLLSYNKDSNTITMTKAAFNDKPGTRDNLELGTGNTPEFRGLYLTEGSLEIRRNSNDTAPSGSIVARRATAAGVTIVSSETRANQNGSIEWIKRDSSGNPRTIAITQDNEVTLNGLTFCPPNMEIGKANSAGSKYIDFHYDGTKNYDYSARIICDGMNVEESGRGNLRFQAGFMSFTAQAGMRFDNQLIAINDGAPIAAQARTNGQAAYLLFRDGGSNYGYVGFPSAGSKEITLYNYTTSKGIKVSDKFYADGMDSQFGGNIVCNGSSIYVRGGSGASNTHLWLQNTSGRNRAVFYASDDQKVNIRADNGASGANGQTMSFNGANGECRATTFTNTSDERAKFWIKPVVSALDKICSLRGVTYSMHTTIQDTVRKAGVIAQDVQKVLPEAVTHSNMKGVIDKECREIENPLGVDYAALSALYIEAIKELKAEVDALKTEVEILKAK